MCPVICKCKYELLWAKHFYHFEYTDHCLFSFKYSNHCILLLPVPGFTDACSIVSIFWMISGLCIITIHYHTALSINVLQGVIMLMDLNHKMCGEWRAGSCWD